MRDWGCAPASSTRRTVEDEQLWPNVSRVLHPSIAIVVHHDVHEILVERQTFSDTVPAVAIRIACVILSLREAPGGGFTPAMFFANESRHQMPIAHQRV